MRVLSALVLTAILAGCTSPEATRQRAGGPGADVGNRGEVRLHPGSDPYHGTPDHLGSLGASHAAASPRSSR